MRTIFIGLVAALIALPASAQTDGDNWKRCVELNPEVQIVACTAAIQSGRESPDDLAGDYLNRAGAYLAKGQFDKAIADFTQAIALEPRPAFDYKLRGNAFDAKGLHDRAIADYTKAIALNPGTLEIYSDRAWAYHLKGEDVRALRDADTAVALDPTDEYAIRTRAEIYEKLGRRAEAIADYRTALKLKPDTKETQDGLKRLGATP